MTDEEPAQNAEDRDDPTIKLTGNYAAFTRALTRWAERVEQLASAMAPAVKRLEERQQEIIDSFAFLADESIGELGTRLDRQAVDFEEAARKLAERIRPALAEHQKLASRLASPAAEMARQYQRLGEDLRPLIEATLEAEAVAVRDLGVASAEIAEAVTSSPVSPGTEALTWLIERVLRAGRELDLDGTTIFRVVMVLATVYTLWSDHRDGIEDARYRTGAEADRARIERKVEQTREGVTEMGAELDSIADALEEDPE